MKKCLPVVVAAALAMSALAGVASASAATEFGSGCAATTVAPLRSLVSVAHGPTSPLPVAAPSAGVITEWKLNADLTELGPEEAAELGAAEGAELSPEEEAELGNALVQQLIVMRPAGPSRYTVVGKAESSGMDLIGVNSYPAHIPVQQGDLLGLSGAFTLACGTTDPGDAVAPFFGSAPTGVTVEAEAPVSEAQVPVVARIEPDVDNDGSGDETQDKCPQSPAYQAPCPVVTINSRPVAGKKAVTLYVATSLSAPVGVTATVRLGKGKTATITAAAQTVAPGTLTPFTLTFTKQVAKALKKLPPKRTLRMSLTASAANLTGSPSTTTSGVRLHGRAKPVHHKKRKPKKR